MVIPKPGLERYLIVSQPLYRLASVLRRRDLTNARPAR
jgi:hypothetical protein